MKAKYILIAMTAVALSLVSCDQDLLDIPQKGVQSEQNFYQTDDDCDQALAAAYAMFRKVYSGKVSIGQYSCAFFIKNLLSDDILPGGVRSDQTYAQELAELCTVSTNWWVQLYYDFLYETVYLSNIVLEKFDANDSAVKARDIAEARGLRAMAYYDLVTMWGKAPLVTKVLTDTEEFKVSNVESESEIWGFIESELKEIIASGKLTQRQSVSDVDGSARFTIDAARTLLGKSYMYQGKYSEAKAVLQDVIKSGKFALISDISTFYHPQANGCSEYIFENVRHYDPSNMYNQDGWHGILANWAFGYGFIIGPEANSFYNFNPNGYSYFNPTKELYDLFVKEEGKDGMRVNAWIVPFDKFPEIGVGVNATRNNYGNEGYFRLKWLASKDDENVTIWCANQSNTPVFKYDDVLLLAAEACFQTGDTPTALTYVNEVRRRVNLPDRTSLTLDDIKLERRLELAMDGVRFQDLKRWGDAPTVLANKGKKLPTMTIVPDAGNDLSSAEGFRNAKYTWSVTYVDNEKPDAGWTVGRDEYLPFPQNEIDVNPNIRQNPGY